MTSNTNNLKLNGSPRTISIEDGAQTPKNLSEADQNSKRTQIRVLTYNIFLRPPMIKNNESDFKEERLDELLKAIHNYDVICLQEMFSLLNKRKEKLIRYAKSVGFNYYADAPAPSFFASFVVDGGLLILSRYPIKAVEFKPYPYGIFSDSLAQKGALYAKIQIKDEVLHIFNTHTQASYFGENQRYPILTRAEQFKMLRNFVIKSLEKNSYKNGDLVLLVGDFNVDSRNPFIETTKIKHHPGFREYPHLSRKDRFNEYEGMLCYLSDNSKDDIDDLLFTYGEHPVTYAESSKDGKPLEVVLTHKDDLCSNQSLDYIFKLNPKTLIRKLEKNSADKEPKEPKLMVVEKSAKVEKFFVPLKHFTQISDHYGCSVTLEYREPLSLDSRSSSDLESVATESG